MSACTLFNEQGKGSNLLSIITRSVLGKKNHKRKRSIKRMLENKIHLT